MSTKLLVSQLCVLCLILVSVQAGKVTVRLTLISYSNPTGRDWLNQRCDDRGFTAGECDTYLKVCLDSPTGLYHGFTNALNNCNYTTKVSTRFDGHSPMFTGSNIGFPNPLEYNISNWQGSFQVKVATYDADKFTADDVIDVLLYRYEDPPAKSLQEAGSGITKVVEGSGPGAQTSLTINVVVYCSEFYYYPTPGDLADPCSLYCKPDNSSTGHYNCTETGQRICLPGWMNETSNCLVSTNRQTDIKTNGTQIITGPDLEQLTATGNGSGNHLNWIIGLIVGLFLLLLIIVLLIALLLRNKRKRKQKDQASSAYVNTAVAGQQTSTTASNSAGTATYDNPLYLNKANGTAAESPYSEVDYSMVKLPLGGAYGPVAIPAATAKAREAGVLPAESYYDRNLKYNPKNTQPSPLMQDERSRARYGMGGNERGAVGGSDMGMAEGVRGGFSPMGGDSTMYGFADNRFENPTYEAPNLDVDVPGKVSVVKKMAGLYDEPIKYKM